MVEEHVIYRRFATVLSPFHSTRISRMLTFAGIESDHELWIGSRVLLSVLFALIGFLVPLSVFRVMGLYSFNFASLSHQDTLFLFSVSFGCAMISTIFGLILIYLHVYYLVSDRTKRVEEILPDFLLMVAANLRAGLTPFSAFQASARPEFGPLEKEIRIVASKSLGSESFTTALVQLTERIDSGLLRRTILFFEEGLRSGGKLAQLLETSAEEIREMENLKKELALNTQTYTIFLVFVLMFGLPLLLSVSSQFLITFSQITEDIGLGAEAEQFSTIAPPTISIDANFVNLMGFMMIAGSTLMVSVLIGVIREGKLLYGVKYFIPLLLGTGAMFLIFRALISGFMAQIF